MKYTKTNREKSKTAKRIKFWCSGCDQEMAETTGKCSNCGYIHNRDYNKSKLKKF